MARPCSGFLALLVALPGAAAFTTPARPATPASRTAAAARMAYAGEGDEYYAMVARDSLMRRTVDVQVNAYGLVRDIGSHTWLRNTWTTFLGEKRPEGKLTDFLGVVHSSPTSSVYVPNPRIAFRQLSPNNPYLNQEAGGGTEVEVEPAKVGRRLMTCREKLAEDWVSSCLRISSAALEGAKEAEERNRFDRDSMRERDANATSLASVMQISEGDEQLLKGIAMRLAVRELLHELSLRPSQGATKEWLDRFVFFHRADDLTRNGSVERLLFELETQPVVIRGGALVDPIDIKRELLIRKSRIVDAMAEMLRTAPDDHAAYHMSFLEDCLNLDDP